MSGPLSNPYMFKSAAGGADFYTHQISNSCRFDGAGKFLITNGSAPTNAKKYTFSTWVKRSELGNKGELIAAETDNVNYDDFNFNSSDELEQVSQRTSSYKTSDVRLFRDPSAFYHVVAQWDTSLASATDRLKVYINGVRLTWDQTAYDGALPQDTALKFNENGASLSIGYSVSNSGIFEGYMAQTAGIDGSIVAIGDLGETKNGVWIAKDLSGLTFGNNGFLLDYASSSDMGNDVSGNNNDFTPTSISAHDQMLDTPTFNSSSNGGNFATLNPLNTRGSTAVTTQLASEGNLKWTPNATQDETSGTMSIGAGGVDKVYIEVYCENNSDTGWFGVYDQKDGSLMNAVIQSTASSVRFKPRTGDKVTAGTSSTYIGDGSESNPSGVIFQMAVDVPAGKIWWGRNNAWGSDGADHIDDDNVAFTTLNTDGTYLLFTHTGGASVAQPDWIFNFGQDGTFAGNKTAQGNSDATGYGNFYYSPPTGFKALCAGNVSVADAVDPAQTDDNYPQKLFEALTYTGTGSSGSITTKFQPDFIWMKNRGTTKRHYLVDSNRGINSTSPYLHSDQSVSEGTGNSTGVSGVSSTSISFGGGLDYVNASSNTYVSWHWRANGGTTAANSVGGTSSVTQVDPSKALSIVTYTGISGSSGSSTVGHGMGVVPQLIFHKARNASGGWWTQFAFGTNANYFLELNGTRAQTELAAGTYGAMSRPTTSVFSINGVDGVGGESRNYVAYCFANIEGYCKVGSYVGNGNADGSFVYCGFKPAWLMIKQVDSTSNWNIFDTTRDTYNYTSKHLAADSSAQEYNGASYSLDILSNGFKMVSTWGQINGNGNDYVFLAMADVPAKYATAR